MRTDLWFVVLLALGLAACGGDTAVDGGAPGVDSGTNDAAAPPTDAALDDAGDADASVDAAVDPDAATGLDAAVSDDAGPQPDAGIDTSLYDACDGNTFFPTACTGGACIDAGLEQRVYDIWRERFMAIHRLSAIEMDTRIVISDVSVADGPSFVFWRIDYVFVMDWVRSRQSESVRLGSFPLPAPPTDPEITRAVNLAIETAERFDLPSVSTIAGVDAAFDGCVPGMIVDYCHLDFVNVTGELTVRARKPRGGGTCDVATVDVGAGALLLCVAEPCAIM